MNDTTAPTTSSAANAEDRYLALGKVTLRSGALPVCKALANGVGGNRLQKRGPIRDLHDGFVQILGRSIFEQESLSASLHSLEHQRTLVEGRE